MEFRAITRETLDVGQWDALIGSGSFFQSADWADVCLRGLGGAALFLCGYRDNRLVAGMPGLVMKKLGCTSFLSMPFGTYGGAVWHDAAAESDRRDFFGHLDNFFHDRHFSKVIIADGTDALAGWEPAGFHDDRPFTHLVEVDDPVGLIEPRKKVAAEIRAGEKHGGDIRPLNDAAQVDDFYALYEKTERRHGRRRPLYRKRFFDAVFSVLESSDNLHWNGLWIDGRMIGSQIHFIRGDTLTYWQSVSDHDYRTYRPTYRLLFEALSKAAAGGVRRVNLGASPENAEGLIFFKERWGGRRHEYRILTAQSWWRKVLRR